MTAIDKVKKQLQDNPKTWLISGVAGFIGSNLLEELLGLGQKVVGIDNFSTGKKENLQAVRESVTREAWAKFIFHEADIRDLQACRAVTVGVDYVLHQAALGSVPRSIDDPITTNQNNIDGFLNMLVAARDTRVKRFVYAASSSTYGDHPGLPKVEDIIGKPLSPYAVTKYVNELYADVFARTYDMETIGLRYFNVFGKRQDPEGAYAAVIPKWIGQLLRHEAPKINGDGETSRDFCYIDNTVQMNLLAATSQGYGAVNQIYNVACGERTTLNALFALLQKELIVYDEQVANITVQYGSARIGDVKHSLADITKAKTLLDYLPMYDISSGMKQAIFWYVDQYLLRNTTARPTPMLTSNQPE